MSDKVLSSLWKPLSYDSVIEENLHLSFMLLLLSHDDKNNVFFV